LYAFFWVVPQRLNFICRRFGTLCLFHLHRQVGVLQLPASEDGTECSETSAYKIQTPGNYPEESVQYSEHGESFKSGKNILVGMNGNVITEFIILKTKLWIKKEYFDQPLSFNP